MDSFSADGAIKRKRSPSASQPASAPAAKVSKTTNQLSINYLARQSQEDLPLINKDASFPNLLHLLSQYSNVLDRHESLASNLGARPLGPNLIKRFERCFDAPPKIVASHHKGGASNPEDSPHHITWLEVIEFARSHPNQFSLATFSEGKRVCQFYYPQKQLRVQVAEEDFIFISSGRCQELIPPLPIWEDEEKEVATCDVLEARLKELTNAADMVAARTRQLSHRLKGRRAAILERRAEGGSGTPAKASAQQTTTAPPSSNSAFTAVNTTNGPPGTEATEPTLGSTVSTRNELLRHFESLPHNQDQPRAQGRHHSIAVPTQAPPTQPATEGDSGRPASNASSLSPVPPNAFSNGDILTYYTTDTPPAGGQTSNPGQRPPSSAGTHAYSSSLSASKHNFSRPLPPALESSQPFRPLCQAHMDVLPKGQRVMPPCDRCRRLRMDCVKNLTSCAGCTKKHARCHWRDVSREELGELDHLMEMETMHNPTMASSTDRAAYIHANGYSDAGSDVGDPRHDESDDDDSNPLEDLEALEEKEERETEAAAEQLREDEEGLRQARELAMQSWSHDDVEKTASEAKLDHEASANVSTTPEPEHRPYEPIDPAPSEKLDLKPVVESIPAATTQPLYDLKAPDEPLQNGQAVLETVETVQPEAIATGFRAVNAL